MSTRLPETSCSQPHSQPTHSPKLTAHSSEARMVIPDPAAPGSMHAGPNSPPSFIFHAPVRAGGEARQSPGGIREDMGERLARTLIDPETSIAEALRRLNDAGTGILLVADARRMLMGVISDGDIRRHLM